MMYHHDTLLTTSYWEEGLVCISRACVESGSQSGNTIICFGVWGCDYSSVSLDVHVNT